MKILYFLGIVLVASGANCAQAQSYRIFRPGLTYQLSESGTAGDTTHVLRLLSADQQGADSVFRFNGRTSRSVVSPQNCSPRSVTHRPDNLFGATLTVRATGEQVLGTANGRTLTLRPRAALGQPWAATTAGLSAQVSSRAPGAVLGRADSLATITFSDGQSIVISKTYGLLSGPTLGRYLNPRLPQKQLTLTALPEARLGAARMGVLAIYDFQPGDVFLRRTEVYHATLPCVTRSWTRDSIVSRRDNPVGDSIIYQVRSQTYSSSCFGRGLEPAKMQVLAISPNYALANGTDNESPLTSFWAGSVSRGGRLHYPAWRKADYNGRPQQQHANYMACNSMQVVADTITLMDASSLDAGAYVWTAPGLGQTRAYFPNFTTEETNLIGYRKGTETWGQLTSFAQLMLPTRAARPSSRLAAYPVPCQATLSVSFELSQAQPVGAELRDALGRVVLSAPATAYASGPQRLELATAALPAGCYQLHLQLVSDKRTEVLRVLKQ